MGYCKVNDNTMDIQPQVCGGKIVDLKYTLTFHIITHIYLC